MGKTGGGGDFQRKRGGSGDLHSFPANSVLLLAHDYSFRVRVSILRSGTKILIQLTRELLYLVQEPLLYRYKELHFTETSAVKVCTTVLYR